MTSQKWKVEKADADLSASSDRTFHFSLSTLNLNEDLPLPAEGQEEGVGLDWGGGARIDLSPDVLPEGLVRRRRSLETLQEMDAGGPAVRARERRAAPIPGHQPEGLVIQRRIEKLMEHVAGEERQERRFHRGG